MIGSLPSSCVFLRVCLFIDLPICAVLSSWQCLKRSLLIFIFVVSQIETLSRKFDQKIPVPTQGKMHLVNSKHTRIHTNRHAFITNNRAHINPRKSWPRHRNTHTDTRTHTGHESDSCVLKIFQIGLNMLMIYTQYFLTAWQASLGFEKPKSISTVTYR